MHTQFIAHLECGPHHRVYVSRNPDTAQLHLFKYTDHACDYLITSDQDEASDWIATPLKGFMWVDMGEDDTNPFKQLPGG